MPASSVLQPRKSEVKHGVRHREQPRKQEARGNTQTATPPQAQARPRQSPGNAEPPTRARAPTACQSPPARTTAPSMRQSPSVRRAPPARARPPSVPEPASACQSPARARPPARARAPRVPGRKPGGFAADHVLASRTPPQRAPGQKPGSGASTEPTIGLWDANRATRRVPRALAGPSSESPRQRIVILSGLGQNKRFFAASRPKHAIICAIGKPIREQPAKSSVSHFRYREKPSVLTASDQNRRFFASRTLHDSPFPCPTSSTPVIDLGDGGLLRQA